MRPVVEDTMKAVLKNGLIHPQEPLPEDWTEGTEVIVRRRKSAPTKRRKDRADQWMDAVEAAAAKGTVEDDRRLMEAIEKIRSQNKQLARKKPGPIE